MNERIKLSRTTATTFDDATLQRVAAKLREAHGGAAKPGETLHHYAASEIDRETRELMLKTGASYKDCHAVVVRSKPHLLYLCVCEIAADRDADVEIVEVRQ